MRSNLLLVALLLFAAVPARAASFRVLTNNFFAGATDVSVDGSSVVAYENGSSGGGSIYRSRGGTNTFVAFGEYIGAGGTSADGSVVVGMTGTGGNFQAFRWQNGQLAYLGSGAQFAHDISADASTIVGSGSGGAFMHQGGIVTYLDDLPGGATSSSAFGVSGDGAVVVGYGSSSLGTEAFRWQGGVMQPLGDLDGGDFGSLAWDITLDGSIVVGEGTGASGGEAFRWENGVMNGLGQLGGIPTAAYAVSADGSTIVGSAEDGLGGVAVIWDPAHGMRDLKQVLEQEFGIDLSQFELLTALGISSDGLTIAGAGRDLGTGRQIGWVVTIPEPSTLPMLAFGLLGLAWRRRG